MAADKLTTHAVILAGGRGTRFWPRSRTRTPKQLLNIVGEDTMLEQTVARLRPLIPPERIWTVTNREQAQGVAKQVPSLARQRVLTEPIGRNTAAAIALAADRMMPSDRRPPDPREWRTRFFDQLKLTPPQRDSATVIYDDRDKRFKALMDQHKAVLEPVRAAQDSITSETRQRMTHLLTSEQKAIYDQMLQAQRDRSGRGGRDGR